MKKFLFTLAALLMAGTAFADNYLFIEDFEVTEESYMEGLVDADGNEFTGLLIPVAAHFDQYVSAWQLAITMPDGLTVKNFMTGDAATISYKNNLGQNKTVEAGITTTDFLNYIALTSATVMGYWKPEGSTKWESYGVVKWEPGDYADMIYLMVDVAPNFNGGEIVVHTEPASGSDTRGEVCPKNTEFDKVCTVTVEGGTVEPEVTATPVINWDEETFTVSATGAGTVKLYVNGEEVSNPYTFELGEEETTYTVTATAQEEGKEISETATLEVTVPAAPVVVEVTEKPVITWEANDETQEVVITVTGAGELVLYNDDIEVARGESPLTYTVPYTDDPEGEEMGFSATAKEEGKEVSEYALATVEVPGKSVEPQPYETPAPEIVETMTDDALLITANGEGTVTLYVQTIDNETGEMTTETYEGEGTVSAVIPRGDEAYFINYWAVAQANEDAEPGSTQVSYFIEVPAKEIIPVDPSHEQGVWIVTFLAGGEEFWQEMLPSNEDYTCIVRFSYGNYGTFPYDPNKSMAENDAMRPDMPFYIVIDGVRYGAAEDGTLCVLGTALSNELFENENLYVLEHALGRVYNMGVAIDELDPSKKYVYAAVAAYTEVEEMNASKTVAGVRYFNMAGQEMQEANGMTIVVTTYTDGTTSAVKVMK